MCVPVMFYVLVATYDSLRFFIKSVQYTLGFMIEECFVQRAGETELSSYKDQVELLQSDLSAKTQEMEELLKAVECLQSKVISENHSFSCQLFGDIFATFSIVDHSLYHITCRPKYQQHLESPLNSLTAS